MNALASPERQELAAAIRRFVGRRGPSSSSRQLLDLPAEELDTLWRDLTSDLGLAAISVPTEYGGAGAGASDITVALYELGAGLVPSPLIASVLTVEALRALDDEQARRDYLPRLATGELIATVAVGCDPLVGTAAGGDVRLSGACGPVPYGAQAELIIVPAHVDDQLVACALHANSPGIERRLLSSIDRRSPVARVEAHQAPARVVSGNGPAAFAAVEALADLAVAAEQAGATAACLEMTIEYARQRVAFGQPIGTYQAVKHRLADGHVAWALGHAALREAARCADEDSVRFATSALTARVTLSQAYLDAARTTVQIHGGIGYIWEHSAHVFYRHALATGALFGGHRRRVDRLAALVLDRPEPR